MRFVELTLNPPLKKGWQCCFSKPYLLFPLLPSNIESTENDFIASGGGEGGKYVIFTGYCLHVPRVLARVVPGICLGLSVPTMFACLSAD